MPLSEKEVLGALAALEESACLLRGQWYAERHFRHKGRIDLVTTMDVKIQQTLGAALGRVTPGVPLVAEEGNDGEPVFPERCWIVDPIDGTTNFVHGIPLVGITAAFWEHDGPVFGMTACPMLNETWWAVKGQGAFLNGRPVSVSVSAAPCARGSGARGGQPQGSFRERPGQIRGDALNEVFLKRTASRLRPRPRRVSGHARSGEEPFRGDESRPSGDYVLRHALWHGREETDEPVSARAARLADPLEGHVKGFVQKFGSGGAEDLHGGDARPSRHGKGKTCQPAVIEAHQGAAVPVHGQEAEHGDGEALFQGFLLGRHHEEAPPAVQDFH